MEPAPSGDELPIYDVIGIGFGPSNLAMAIALVEHNTRATARSGPSWRPPVADGVCQEAVTAHFLERQPRFGWHRGMLIEDATMQVSFLKDLVTLRNPTSEYSFLCYLRDRDRLVDFVNHKNLFPLRVEFHDYFDWAAAKVDDLVSYDCEVVAVRPVFVGDTVAYLDVTARSGHSDGHADSRADSRAGGQARHEITYRARNLIVGTGLRPHLPEGVGQTDRVWHNRDLLSRVEGIAPSDPRRFVVIGAGQSAAETVAFLHERFPKAEICSVFGRYGYSPADDSAFANRIFDPQAVDEYFTAPEDVKRKLMDYHGNTNYAVVDIDLIDDLYRRVYRERVLGVRRLRIFNMSSIVDVTRGVAGVRVVVASQATGEHTVLDADAVVYATGYRPTDPLELLGEVGRYCQRDGQGRPRVGRDYRILTAPELDCGIYLQGATEHSHGISSSLLSNTAVRVGEILASIVDGESRRVIPHPRYAVGGIVTPS